MSKIAIVMHDLRGGGAEKMMVRLANQLVADGDRVEIITIGSGGVNVRHVDNRIKLTQLSCKRTILSFTPLRNALQSAEPEAVLSVLTHINVITFFVCFSLGWLKKLSVSERNAFSLDKKVNSDFTMRIAYSLAPFIYRILPKPVICVSQGVASELSNSTLIREKDVISLPNPVITEKVTALSKKPAKHDWLVSKTSHVIIGVGRLSHQKGFDYLLETLKIINQEVDCKLILFGEGDLMESLNNRATSMGLKDKVSFAGYSDNVIAEVNAADLYVLSSRFEGSPNALVEAMHTGTSVVAFDCPYGAAEILRGGEVAPLIEHKNVKELASSCIELLRNPLPKDKLIKESQRFTSQYSAQLYREALLKNHTSGV